MQQSNDFFTKIEYSWTIVFVLRKLAYAICSVFKAVKTDNFQIKKCEHFHFCPMAFKVLEGHPQEVAK